MLAASFILDYESMSLASCTAFFLESHLPRTLGANPFRMMRLRNDSM
jgi:hypothetical protein